MLTVISPAKTLDFKTAPTTKQYSLPLFTEQAQKLINCLQQFSVQEIADLMKLSDKLASLNLARYASWQQESNLKNAKQAILAFKGDVYTGLDAESLSNDDLAFAQKHLRILSGLYAILKPLDLIQPYRLEMGTKLETGSRKNLYSFWDKLICDSINQDLNKSDSDILLNLASNEYFKAVQEKSINAQIITPIFKDWKNNQYKIISFYAKKARGLMSRYIIKNKINNPEQLKDFDLAGYSFSDSLSNGNNWVFTRDITTT